MTQHSPESSAARVIAIIPARLASTRLPNKPLLDIAGKPMILWVYERTSRADSVERVMVATCDDEIVEVVKSFDGEAVMTSEKTYGIKKIVRKKARPGRSRPTMIASSRDMGN